MADSTSPRGVTRRTVARGAAWAVPAVAVAVPASAMAGSGYVPPPPVITFGNACGNVGAKFKGCGGDKTIQVPLTLTNLGPTDIVFQITSMYTCNNCALAPTGPGAGHSVQLRGWCHQRVHRRAFRQQRPQLLDRVRVVGLGQQLPDDHQLAAPERQ